MQKILENVFLIENEKGANVYLIDNGDSFDLVDAGIFKETDKLIAKIEEEGFHIDKLKTVILTHCHCDHIGGAAELVRRTGAKLAAHFEDIPYMLQNKVISGHYRNMMLQEQLYMKKFNCNIQRIDIALSDKDKIETLGGLEVIHVPGHTPGSIALYQAEKKIMFFGDVIRNEKIKGLVIGVPEKYNFDTVRTVIDARKLTEYPIDYALFSHGLPITENTKERLVMAKTPDEASASKQNVKIKV